jgi:hypothetical protein
LSALCCWSSSAGFAFYASVAAHPCNALSRWHSSSLQQG